MSARVSVVSSIEKVRRRWAERGWVPSERGRRAEGVNEAWVQCVCSWLVLGNGEGLSGVDE